MKTGQRPILKLLTPALALAAFFAVGAASGQSLQPNQTHDVSGGNLTQLTYLQNADCVDRPRMTSFTTGCPLLRPSRVISDSMMDMP